MTSRTPGRASAASSISSCFFARLECGCLPLSRFVMSFILALWLCASAGALRYGFKATSYLTNSSRANTKFLAFSSRLPRIERHIPAIRCLTHHDTCEGRPRSPSPDPCTTRDRSRVGGLRRVLSDRRSTEVADVPFRFRRFGHESGSWVSLNLEFGRTKKPAVGQRDSENMGDPRHCGIGTSLKQVIQHPPMKANCVP